MHFESKIDLGAEVRSKVMGFQGIVTSVSIHLNGCNRCWVQPKVGKDGKIPDGSWIDEPELELVNKPKIKKGTTNQGGFPSRVK